MNIGIIGSGHVGLVTGACFADLGNDVICMDNDSQKIKLLQRGQIPFFEPGLSELVQKNHSEGRLRFTTSIRDVVHTSKIIFLCVGTPSTANGDADLSAIEHVTKKIVESLREYRVIVEKSTVPVETGALLYQMIKQVNRRRIPFDVASNPEFLKEGDALNDFLMPCRVVIGTTSEKARALMHDLYKPFLKTDDQFIAMDITSAVPHIKPQVGFASFLIRAVTLKTVVGQDRQNVA